MRESMDFLKKNKERLEGETDRRKQEDKGRG
jgi:hypothetical protein